MKSHFFNDLVAKNLDGKWWEMFAPLAYYSEKYNKTFLVPVKFITDFASVPRIPVAHLIAGGTGKWEATFHDMNYRWGFLPRIDSDKMFYECGEVRSEMRENQDWINRKGRVLRNTLMTAGVLTFGWTAYKNYPGCLDYRNKKTCGQKCNSCKKYYPLWEKCCIDGYEPYIIEYHAEETKRLWNLNNT